MRRLTFYSLLAFGVLACIGPVIGEETFRRIVWVGIEVAEAQCRTTAMPTVNGMQAGHCIITPVCRANRGNDGAWLEACDRLRKKYDECLGRADIDQCDFHLLLTIETPRHKADAK